MTNNKFMIGKKLFLHDFITRRNAYLTIVSKTNSLFVRFCFKLFCIVAYKKRLKNNYYSIAHSLVIMKFRPMFISNLLLVSRGRERHVISHMQ
jgi:hypothetical protein